MPVSVTPWLTILCKFAGSDEPVPAGLETAADFDARMQDAFPGLGDFWREVSYGAFSLAGSRTAGWYTLPGANEDYARNGGVEFDRLTEDAITLAETRDGIDAFDFYGVTIAVLGDLAGSNWGVRRDVTHHGRTKVMGVAWLPATAFRSLHDVGHEMGHGYGLPHSEGIDFDHTLQPSSWDVMSAGAYKRPRPPFDRLDVHTIAYHKGLLGLLDEGRVVTFGGGVQRVVLERLAQPATADALMVRIPIDGSDARVYTVEARRRVGYDAGLPAEGIVIHEIDEHRPGFTWVDPDTGASREVWPGPAWLVGNPATSDGYWTAEAGKNLFYDARSRIGVMVRRETPSRTGYEVAIWVGPPAPGKPRVSKRSATTIEITWQGDFPPGTRFVGAVGPAGGVLEAVDLGAGPSSGMFGGLQPGTDYELAVKAIDDGGESDFTPRIRGRTAAGSPARRQANTTYWRRKRSTDV